jgi:hypothetical protein
MQLPLELWYLVADNLNVLQIIPFLGISKIHRSIAHKLLFSDIELFFGPPELEEVEMSNKASNQLNDNTMNRTWEILNAIRRNPSFAQVVVKLSIHTFMAEEDFGVFYWMPICEALQALPHLLSFTWDGASHALPAQVLECILTYCPNLRTLSFPSVFTFSCS